MADRIRRGALLIAAALLALGITAGAYAQGVGAAAGSPAVRIKDIARLQPVRDNQLTGLGLVVGLNGTGDGTGSRANIQMVANMLERFGISVDADDLRLRNAAAVMVTATLPPFVRPGDRIDVTVSSFGDARSLQGGFLLQTPLTAADGEVYAVAQGAVSIGGFNVRGGRGASVQQNHPVVGSVANGAIVERSVPISLGHDGILTWVLHEADFSTAARLAEAVNERFGPGSAQALDGSAVAVLVPDVLAGDPIAFASMVEELTIVPDRAARVVINERTGTVVLGHQVRIATVAVAHGGLTVRIEPEVDVSQPPPLSGGDTVVVQRPRVRVEQATGELMVLEPGVNVQDLVQALNAVGANPRDVIAILQAIKSAGALYGELEVL